MISALVRRRLAADVLVPDQVQRLRRLQRRGAQAVRPARSGAGSAGSAGSGAANGSRPVNCGEQQELADAELQLARQPAAAKDRADVGQGQRRVGVEAERRGDLAELVGGERNAARRASAWARSFCVCSVRKLPKPSSAKARPASAAPGSGTSAGRATLRRACRSARSRPAAAAGPCFGLRLSALITRLHHAEARQQRQEAGIEPLQVHRVIGVVRESGPPGRAR